MTTAFPLAWPQWVKRAASRQDAAFGKRVTTDRGWKASKSLTVADARDRLQAELDRLGAKSPVLSSNIELRLDGQPRSGIEPTDPGIAVYFMLKGKQLCMPCDKWSRVADNIAAVAAHIDAVRRIERYGVQSVEEAFAGFVALPAPKTWREILEVAGAADLKVSEAAYRALARKHHPDNGGSSFKMAELNQARDDMRKELS